MTIDKMQQPIVKHEEDERKAKAADKGPPCGSDGRVLGVKYQKGVVPGHGVSVNPHTLKPLGGIVAAMKLADLADPPSEQDKPLYLGALEVATFLYGHFGYRERNEHGHLVVYRPNINKALECADRWLAHSPACSAALRAKYRVLYEMAVQRRAEPSSDELRRLRQCVLGAALAVAAHHQADAQWQKEEDMLAVLEHLSQAQQV